MNDYIKDFEEQLKAAQSRSTTLTLSAFKQLFINQNNTLVESLRTQGFAKSSTVVNKSEEAVYDISDKLIE